MKVAITQQAFEDLKDIRTWHVKHTSNVRASAIVQGIRRSLRHLARNPEMGKVREEFGSGVRVLVSGNYLILYMIGSDAVYVHAVIDGKRDLSLLHLPNE